MQETLNAIIHAIKLLENRQHDSAEVLLRQEVLNIHRKFLAGIAASKDVVDEKELKSLLDEAKKYLDLE